MFMVDIDPGAGTRAAAFAEGVRVVESQQALRRRCAGLRVIQTMRLLLCCRDLFHSELHPKISLCYKYLAVEQEQSIEARITF